VSQPDRITLDDLTTMTAVDRDSFATTVLIPLAAHGDELTALAARLDALGVPDNRWGRELTDGVAVNRARLRFVLAGYRAALAHLAGDAAAATAAHADAVAALTAGQAIVTGRHHDLHDDHGDRLTAKGANATTYGYGYLHWADNLCYWHRELAQLEAILGVGDGAAIPGCFF
jgi:hypothetical protein